MHTTQGLVNRAYVEELWELALSKTIAALRTHSVCLHTTHSTHTLNRQAVKLFSRGINLKANLEG